MNTQTLIITEKPSVARAIAAALGANVRGDGCIHGNNLIVSWCYGHLVELAVPAAYDEKLSKWRREDLPILPEPWKISVMRDKWTQFEILRGLMQRTDVGEVVNACDAGREGELIFRLVYEKAGCTKSVKRLWLSSMEPDEIRKAYANMRPGAEYDNLYAAALCRAKADWLVGMNATRLMSLVYHRTLNVGRVVSPTLSLLVERKREIEEFKPETFYTVALDCGGVLLSSERLADKAEADTLADMCHEAHIVKVERREKRENPPALYDLTALQREANRELGFTAQQTLDYLQSALRKAARDLPAHGQPLSDRRHGGKGAGVGGRRVEAAGRGRARERQRCCCLRQLARDRPPRRCTHAERRASYSCRTARGRGGCSAARLPPAAVRGFRAVHLRRNRGRSRVRRTHLQG